jgi:hypothetical protein
MDTRKQTSPNKPELAYSHELLNVPLDASLVPKITDAVFVLLRDERSALIEAVNGLKKEVEHYKHLLITQHDMSMRVLN